MPIDTYPISTAAGMFNGPEPRRSFVTTGSAVRRHGDASTHVHLHSRSAALPAYALRRSGLLDPLDESITRYHE